jgi:hypothetical protein
LLTAFLHIAIHLVTVLRAIAVGRSWKALNKRKEGVKNIAMKRRDRHRPSVKRWRERR